MGRIQTDKTINPTQLGIELGRVPLKVKQGVYVDAPTVDEPTLQAAIDAHDVDPDYVDPEWVEPVTPDAPNFLLAVMGGLGKPRGREILRAYPDIHMALRNPYNFTVARQGIDEALADEFLTQAEWDLIDGQWDEHNLPR